MVNAPAFGSEQSQALDALNAKEKRVAIGLHVTLTAPFAPLSDGFHPLRTRHFPSIHEMGRLAHLRRLSTERLALEIRSQLRRFIEAFGRSPDFIDGHQHVHLFPQVRDAFLKVAAEMASGAWVRQCGRARGARRLRDSKALVLDLLSVRFRAKARRLGIRMNPAFAGAYDFASKTDYATIFTRFLAGLPDGGLVMSHPGFVDAQLQSLDPLTYQREREFAFFESEMFPRVLAAHHAVLVSPSESGAAA
jgi:predicted glycoside hydrolase/deacetylase ChbG (UPF0249 family)